MRAQKRTLRIVGDDDDDDDIRAVHLHPNQACHEVDALIPTNLIIAP